MISANTLLSVVSLSITRYVGTVDASIIMDRADTIQPWRFERWSVRGLFDGPWILR